MSAIKSPFAPDAAVPASDGTPSGGAVVGGFAGVDGMGETPNTLSGLPKRVDQFMLGTGDPGPRGGITLPDLSNGAPRTIDQA